MPLDRRYFAESHFELRWPREIIVEELDRLLANSYARNEEECQLLLQEAFRYEEPLQEFDRHVDELEWLTALRRCVEYLPTPREHLPYWSNRHALSRERKRLDFSDTARSVRDLITEFEASGYLAQAFGQECVDSGEETGTLGSAPVVELHRQLGRDKLWPIEAYWRNYKLDDLCDVTEFIHDHVSRPMRRFYHSYSNCGFHYSSFRREIAQRLYRSRVNEIFAQSLINLTLNENGRFEEVSADELEPLIDRVRTDSTSGAGQHDALLHAVEQFRRRGASETEKRQAIVTLAGILEARRQIIKDHLLTKDEGALFAIANQFNLRHQRADQKTDYDPELYFQWLFYWYVATIRLVDRILARQAASS